MSATLISILVIVTCAALIIALERLFPYDKEQHLFREGFWNDLALYTLLQSYILTLVITAFVGWLDGITSLSKLGLLSSWPLWLQLLFALVEHDFYIYWFHRLQHRSHLLWRTHEAHHSTLDVDWLSGSRSHSLEILINQTIEFAPLVLLGFSPVVILFKGTIDAVWGMYIHSNIDIHSGWLQYIINGPEMHRWHHAIDEDAHNKNFGTKLAIWDWMFGTAYFPKHRKPRGYGLGDPNFPKNYIKQHTYAFRKFERS